MELLLPPMAASSFILKYEYIRFSQYCLINLIQLKWTLYAKEDANPYSGYAPYKGTK